ncbi:hypothetical protein ATM97_02860 [Nocardia sp. MH4]|uniref:hypothetical protein n=1 Tax=Nocardia sp. MH4 TaxID=1768677 RepID=UPI001C4ED284|nr:hypothetical protein [Nocardia sp. MH4]MBW0270061.1 hypothetical protein [Nocardia sp. MH4]
MNRNDIRPAAIGIAAGVATLAGLIAWAEFEPHRELAYRLARRRLTAAERAELDRIAAEQRAEQAERARFFEKQDAEQAARRAEDLAGFEPKLLVASRTVATPDELSLEELVAEIVHSEAQYRSSSDWIRDPRAGDHALALRTEWQRRDSGMQRYTRTRVEQLRYDLARNTIKAASNAPWSPPLADLMSELAADREVQP